MPENVDSGVRRETSNVVGECPGGPIDQIRTLGKADGPPGSPMHRDGMGWISAANHLGRLPGIEVAAAQRGPPSPDGHQHEVDLSHVVARDVRTRVPGIPTPVTSLHQIAERRSAMRAPRESPAIVVGREDLYP
jgi:hypothetical protein